MDFEIVIFQLGPFIIQEFIESSQEYNRWLPPVDPAWTGLATYGYAMDNQCP